MAGLAPGANPFFHRGAVRDPAYFVGRVRELRRAIHFVANGQSVAIIGPRRIGKSSLLWQLAHPLVQAAHGLDPARLRHCYVDGEGWGRMGREEIYAGLRERVLAAAGSPAEDGGPAHPYQALGAAVRLATAGGRGLLVMLDEFDALSGNPQLDADFFSSLRALATEQPLIYATVSTRPLLELSYAQLSVRSSPFFNFFAQLRLGLLAPDEAGELPLRYAERAGAPFGPAALALIAALAGPHPLLIQLAGYHAFEMAAELGRPIAPGDVAELGRRFEAEAADHWGYFWHTLGPEGQRLLALLPLLAAANPAEARRLAERGLVVEGADGLRPLSPAFAAFVARQAVPGLTQAPPITLEPAQRLALCRGRPLALTPQEFDLLAYLAARPGRMVPREELAAQLWQSRDRLALESLKTTLKTLRDALGPDKGCIQTVRGQGCVFAPDSVA